MDVFVNFLPLLFVWLIVSSIISIVLFFVVLGFFIKVPRYLKDISLFLNEIALNTVDSVDSDDFDDIDDDL